MSEIIEFLVKIILRLIVFAVLFPIIWVSAIPFILCGSLFVTADYRSNVINGYKVDSKTLIDLGVYIIP